MKEAVKKTLLEVVGCTSIEEIRKEYTRVELRRFRMVNEAILDEIYGKVENQLEYAMQIKDDQIGRELKRLRALIEDEDRIIISRSSLLAQINKIITYSDIPANTGII